MDDVRSIVTLVVPIRNEEANIDACLASIVAQAYPSDRLDVIVVDGESSDATPTLVERWTRRDRRVRMLPNPGRAMTLGLNIGIKAAHGDYVGVVSGHSVLPGGYVAKMVEASERTGAWSVGGRIVRVGTSAMQRAIARATSSRIGVGDSRHNYASEAGWVETVFPGFWRRDVFERVGLFDPAMLMNEDNELSLRIRKAGGGIWYDPTVEITYHPRASLAQLFAQYRRYALGKVHVLRKHRGGLRPRNLAPAAWLGFLVVGSVVGIFVPAVALLLAAAVVLYCATVIAAGVWLRTEQAPSHLITLALVTIHLAYALGSWEGLAGWRTS